MLEMAIDNLPNGSDESSLSGAYIRSLVKQLSTTSKPCLNTTQNLNINNNDSLSIIPNYDNNNNNPMTTATPTKKLAMAKPNHQHDQTQGGHHKKQVRRRLHTSRPYQERLLNMAEARKEIVTALKFHRAAMKQANDRKHHHHQQQQNNNEQHANNYDIISHKVKSEPLSEDNSCYYYSSYNRSYNQNYYPPPSNKIISTSSPLIGPTPLYESLNNIPLPHQTLGLNLNLQAFTNLDVNLYHNNITTSNNPSLMTASPSPPSTPRDLTAVAAAEGGMGPTNNMHPSLDEEEIAKMRSIGEQYQIEWDDSLNLAKSAWWFRFLKMVDFGKEIKGCYYNKSDHERLFEEELMEFPPWLGASNDKSFLHQQLDDFCSEDNTTLPWMDIEDIDGMDDDWLS